MSQPFQPIDNRIVDSYTVKSRDLQAYRQSPNFANLEKNRAEVRQGVALRRALIRLGIGAILLGGVWYYTHDQHDHAQQAAVFVQKHPLLLDEMLWQMQILRPIENFGHRWNDDCGIAPGLRRAACDDRLQELDRLAEDCTHLQQDIDDILPHAPAELRPVLERRKQYLQGVLDPKEGKIRILRLLYMQLRDGQ